MDWAFRTSEKVPSPAGFLRRRFHRVSDFSMKSEMLPGTTIKPYLVGGFNPSEKYESQLG